MEVLLLLINDDDGAVLTDSRTWSRVRWRWTSQPCWLSPVSVRNQPDLATSRRNSSSGSSRSSSVSRISERLLIVVVAATNSSTRSRTYSSLIKPIFHYADFPKLPRPGMFREVGIMEFGLYQTQTLCTLLACFNYLLVGLTCALFTAAEFFLIHSCYPF